MIVPVASSDPTYHTNGSKYFTHVEYMFARGSILSGPVALGSDPEAVGPFTDLSITEIALFGTIWLQFV